MTGPSRPRLTSWPAKSLAHLVLGVSWASRYWPVRRLTQRKVRSLNARRFTVATGDGVTIDALHIDRQATDTGRLPVVFAHGWLETKEFHLREAELLARRGHPVILMDLRRHGRSTGKVVTFGVMEKHDVAAVIDEAQRRGWIADRVITIGYSLGAATMLQHAAIDQRVAAVAALAPFNKLTEAVRSFHRHHRWWIGRQYLMHALEQVCTTHGFSMSDSSTIEAVRQLAIPVLLMVGGRDRLLPDALHTRLLVQAKTNGRCQYLQIPRAGHVNLCWGRWPGFDEALTEFCAAV